MRAQTGRAKILSAAVDLFAKQGFHDTSIRQIALAAGVSKGLTYNYFRSKEELLTAIVHQSSQDMFKMADTLATATDHQLALQQFLASYGHALRSHQDHLRFQLSLLFQPGLRELVSPAFEERARRLLAACEAMFRNAGAVHPTLIARRFISELDGIALHHLTVFPDLPLDVMLQQVFDNYGHPT
jgi:AcrR family transcriptional regulator